MLLHNPEEIMFVVSSILLFDVILVLPGETNKNLVVATPVELGSSSNNKKKLKTIKTFSFLLVLFGSGGGVSHKKSER